MAGEYSIERYSLRSKAQLNLHSKYRIDLLKLYNEFKATPEFDVKYYPESFNCVFLTINRMMFRFFSNGKITICGNCSLVAQKKTLIFLIETYVKGSIIETI